MQGIDVGHWKYDRHNALYYFILNADEEIYMRYGGRDADSATTYLNLRSLERALQQGLEMHVDTERQTVTRPAPLFAKDIRKQPPTKVSYGYRPTKLPANMHVYCALHSQ